MFCCWASLGSAGGTLATGPPVCDMECLKISTWYLVLRKHFHNLCAQSFFSLIFPAVLVLLLYAWGSHSVSLSGIPIQWCIWIPTLSLSPFSYCPDILLAIGRGLGPVPPNSLTSFYKPLDASAKKLCCLFLCEHQLQELMLPHPLNYSYYICLP